MLQQKPNYSSDELEKSDKKNIQQLKQLLSSAKSLPRLVSSTGEEVVLSEAVYETLYEVLEAMESGTEITISPLNRSVTVSEAAEILNVSPCYLNKLLNNGDIPYFNIDTARHINRREILDYKHKRDLNRRKGLQEYTRLLQEDGFYS
ncbi:MAG: helix-turn-helix domain-containing protein [Waterburya sp.]